MPTTLQPIYVSVHAGGVVLAGDLTLPRNPTGLIVFAHGSGSSRLSPRNRQVAEALAADGFATLLFDLLTREEEAAERYTKHLRFDIGLLANRIVGALNWVSRQPLLATLPIGLYGASTGAAAALCASTRVTSVAAVVSRGGRPDLAGDALPLVHVPVLLLVGGEDTEVLALNHRALRRLGGPTQLRVIDGAGHLFEEPGTLEEVTREASRWFRRYVPESQYKGELSWQTDR